MDKRVILSVAGSGKTTYILDKLDLDRKILIITYTINNSHTLREGIIKKFGLFPDNIDLSTYYPFLYSFCFRPFLAYKLKPTGFLWDQPPQWTTRINRNKIEYYMSKDGRVYHNRLSKLLFTYNVQEEINERLSKYYDVLFIDEIQDFAGHDFNLLKSLVKANINIELVGDFFQHTFDTSRDGNVNANLHQDYLKYQQEFTSMGVELYKQYLNKSYRCSPSICRFIQNNLGIDIESQKSFDTEVKRITTQNSANDIFFCDEIVKLFYKENYKYDCYSRNWGDCKGENFYKDVCVVLNKRTLDHLLDCKLNTLPPVSRNKLYVACSRASRNLYLISEELVKHYKN